MSATPSTDPVAGALVHLIGRPTSTVVVDVGGGSGTRAVPLARLGCTVVVVDSSIDALAMLARRAADAGVGDRITAIQADAVALSSVVQPGSADLVLCHHLLETVDDPDLTMAAVAGTLRVGGVASVLVAGRLAAVLAHAAAGRFGSATAILADADGRDGPDDPLRHRFDVPALQALLTAAGLATESIAGIGVVSGCAPAGFRPGGGRPGPARPGGDPDEPLRADLEAQLSTHPQLREIATDLHAIARRTDGEGVGP